MAARPSEKGEHRDARLINTPKALSELIDDLRSRPKVAIDIESNGFYNYVERTCILTISVPEYDVVVDTLELWDNGSAMAPFFEAEETEILVHGGSYDVASLKRDFGFGIRNIWDSNIAAQLLDHDEQGLAGLVKQYAGVSLPKELQRYDWTRRPLEERHMQYLAGDTHFLFLLREKLGTEIEAKGLVEELRLECEHLAAQPGAPEPGIDPEDYRKIRGAKSFSDNQRGMLRSVFLLRDKISRELDLAPFRVMGNGTLSQLAQYPPTTSDELDDFGGINRHVVERYAEEIVDALREGRRNPQPRKKPRKKMNNDNGRSSGRRLSPEQRQLEKDLKAWRKQEATRRDVGIQGVLPTQALHEITRELPNSEAALRKIDRMGDSRVDRYGEEILNLVRQISLS